MDDGIIIRSSMKYSKKLNIHFSLLPRQPLGILAILFTFLFFSLLFFTMTSVFERTLMPNKMGLAFLSIVVTVMVLGIGACIVGLISILKKHDRNIFVFIAIVISFMSVSTLGAATWGNPREPPEEEIIRYLLTQYYEKDRYDIFNPEMALDPCIKKNMLRSFFQRDGLNVDSLVNELFAKNIKSVRMSIPSAPEKGYLIDYDGKFQYYLKHINGWGQLRNENPGARSMVYLSVPAYDPNTGLVLIYIGWASDGLLGSGDVILYKYIFGRLLEIDSVTVWIS
jgi:hypothetical protein